MYRLFMVSLLFISLCSPGYAMEYSVKNISGYSLGFNEDAQVTGARKACVRFYSLEEKFEQPMKAPFAELLCEYDAKGHIVGLKEYGVETNYVPKDNKFEITKETELQNIKYSYDDAGRLLGKKDPGQLSKYIYDDKGRLSEIKVFDDDSTSKERGKVTCVKSYTYDSNGNRIKEDKNISPPDIRGSYLDKTTIYGYDAKGRKIKEEIPHDKGTVFAYNDLGRLDMEESYTLEMGRNAEESIVQLIHSYSYNNQGQILNKVTKWQTDQNGLDNRPIGVRVEYGYDKNGNVIKGELFSITKNSGSENEIKEGYFEVEYDPVDNRSFMDDQKK